MAFSARDMRGIKQGLPSKMLRAIIVSLWLLPLSLIAEITLQFSEQSCYPGDLIQLKAQSTSPTFQAFSLNVPKSSPLHIVARRQDPVQFENDRYIQSEVWMIQPKISGEIHLENVTADIQIGETLETVALEPMMLNVMDYPADIFDSDEPEYLPESEVKAPSYGLAIIVVFAFALCIIGPTAWFLWKLKRTTPPRLKTRSISAKDSALYQLRSGKVPTEELFSILEDPQCSLSASARNILERALYSNSKDTDTLIQVLQEEVPR